MINFASLFNQFRGSSNNAINQLLQQNNVTLAKLLDQDSFVNEFKAGNTKLLQFMKYSKFKELVDYITVVGPPEDKKRSFKYPQVAAEVLSSELNAVLDAFLPSGKIYQEQITYEQKIIETEIDPEDQGETLNDPTELTNNSQNNKQKTIIQDSLQSIQEDQLSKQKQGQPEGQKSQHNQQTKQQKANDKRQKPLLKKPKIKVQKIQQVQKIQKVQVHPLIHYLFRYFDQQVNYILTGYVCKVLTGLISKKGNQMMEFLFTDARVYKMINHIESRSVGEFLLKVFTFESNKFIKERALFFEALLIKLAQNNSVHVLSNFSAFISETIEKAAANTKSTSPIPEFTLVFFLPEVVTLVIKNVMSDYENVCVYNAPILLTYLTNVPLTLPKDENIIKQFKSLLDLFFEKSLEKLTVTSKNRPKLGFGRIKIIQILNYILKENLLNSREIFASKPNAFQILFNLCKNYEMNNVLHNQVVKVVSLALSDNTLSQSLLRNDVLVNFLSTQAQQDLNIRKGKGSQKFRKGYVGHVVQIARIVQQYASKGSDVALKILDRDQFGQVLTILVDKQVSEGNKNLGGFSFIKEIKSDIMFQKQQIITRYIDFLTHSPKPVFETQPEPINIEHPDFLEEMQRQIEENLSFEQACKNQVNHGIVKKIEAQPQKLSETQVKIEIHFFKGHLDYALDELMEDL